VPVSEDRSTGGDHPTGDGRSTGDDRSVDERAMYDEWQDRERMEQLLDETEYDTELGMELAEDAQRVVAGGRAASAGRRWARATSRPRRPAAARARRTPSTGW